MSRSRSRREPLQNHTVPPGLRDSSARGDDATRAQPNMVGNGGLSADQTIGSQLRTTRDSGLPREDAARPDPGIVPDLNQSIDPATSADPSGLDHSSGHVDMGPKENIPPQNDAGTVREHEAVGPAAIDRFEQRRHGAGDVARSGIPLVSIILNQRGGLGPLDLWWGTKTEARGADDDVIAQDASGSNGDPGMDDDSGPKPTALANACGTVDA